jgi:hypothetical protein
MTTTRTPSAVVARQVATSGLSCGDGERFAGSGVMGLAFASGHYLALRDMTASSIGPAYRTVWHRDPAGAWTIFTTTDPELSCPRYFGAACSQIERVEVIDVTWTGDCRLRVRMGDRFDWQVDVGTTLSTRLMSRMGCAIPARAWRSDTLLGAIGPLARPVLRCGRVRLRGQTPNQQHFRAAPARVWPVIDSSAVLDGVDLGRPGPLDHQSRLGDFWMPQRGIFFLGTAEFEPSDVTSDSMSFDRKEDRP